MWTIVILAVVAYILKFLYDRGQEIEKVNQEGGMLKKYEVIINRILACNPNAKFFKVAPASVTLGLSGLGGTLIFTLTQAFGKLNIYGTMNSPIFGNHNLSWSFPEHQNQDSMFERILSDLSKFQTHTMNLDSLINEDMEPTCPPTAFKVFTKAEEEKIKASILSKNIEQFTKDEFEYIVSKCFKDEFYKGSNMLQAYKMGFPEEKERLDKIEEVLEDQYYNSDEYLNSLMAEILQDTIEHFKPSVQFSDFFYKTLKIMEEEVDISSYMKEEYEELLQYLLAQSKHEFAFSLICIYQKCYPQEAARLQEYADMLTGQ
ncbi:hypothetical protein [Haliscomenobacter hydrossis]|uniref:Uncharacterized protein n=1 Tax=Haliscomenobacter hydrossis (strain ATCC 27775 / DSM 1100 / LMG 10767 / O) TaxID=760192 RepID=F4L328_HALH1|nr:hypothetical protein [Haliscomenobacter hydrossis]AEE50687.1 hypothetical protein Halhy_2821 [Haliscomenobacter hydrossis DSM 1100]